MRYGWFEYWVFCCERICGNFLSDVVCFWFVLGDDWGLLSCNSFDDWYFKLSRVSYGEGYGACIFGYGCIFWDGFKECDVR